MPTPQQFWLNMPNTQPGDEKEVIMERCIRDLPTGYTLLKSINAGSVNTLANFDFTNIPQNYNQLILDIIARGTSAVAMLNIATILNNDSVAGHYAAIQTQQANTTITGVDDYTQTSIAGNIPGSTATGNLFGWTRIICPNYTNTTTQFKVGTEQVVCLTGTAASDVLLTRGWVWTSVVNPINRITVTPSAGNFALGSQASLYGVF